MLGFHLDFWDYATFVALAILFVAFVVFVVWLAGLPGRIAVARKHPDAIGGNAGVRVETRPTRPNVPPRIECFVACRRPV